MEGEIINKVANSQLVTFDLEEFYPNGQRSVLDISQWLYQGMVLKEKEFRNSVKDHNWEQYKDGYLSIQCSAEAIIPSWAFLLVTLEASRFAKKVVVGTLADLENILFTELIQRMDLSGLQDKPVIIKGCSHKAIPENAFALLAQKLQPIARSIMYGEACSSVPLFKRTK